MIGTKPQTAFEAMRESAHVLRWQPGQTKKTLCCFRCKKTLPGEQFQPFRSNISDRKVRGEPGGNGAYIQYLHPWCYTCKKQTHGEHVAHPHYTPHVDRYWAHRISGIKAGGKLRSILVLIDKDDILGVCLNQENKCAITRMPMSFDMNGEGSNKYTQASVDRIDSSGNYAINNIQIVCNIVNIMKHDLNSKDFVRWCARVVDGRRRADDELLSALE